ncbi:hypothetical protein G5B30_04045 [Sphingobacterium sp. SGG-5]|uniref:glycoside hydrolase family 2 TIM barrel-domain containing protein n=1 Tax=Sphingobacterium sp. SGG-5 TaxID=2710881 RepID=UPI0013EC3EB4|nr:glycoside hydrolase family 2 TIM barrel-domain containing protein [Sphingobacterium sp. SGG-5]NGM61086.1 hypothetical protein [Sphingobacterium sp. SGG-5]
MASIHTLITHMTQTIKKELSNLAGMQIALIALMSIFWISQAFGSGKPKEELRQVLSLNGNWELAYTESFDQAPNRFAYTVPVPGLIDLANPALGMPNNDLLNDKVYWYRCHFKTESAAVVYLKIYKAMYHTKVYINGQLVGENPYSFTSGIFDIGKYLNKPRKDNELIIGVGCRNMLPDTVTNGHDFEKKRYIPGIYDKVEIIRSGYPFITNVQIAPNTEKPSIRVQTNLMLNSKSSQPHKGKIAYVVKELKSGKEVTRGQADYFGKLVDFQVDIPNGRLWSPEDPFLYTLELMTDGDSHVTRFGLRTFGFEEGKPYGLLNGKPYYLRGTNVTLYRFFEDDARQSLPWNDEWVVNLIKSYKSMHWNSARFCIGFPPERWYEIADSLGFLVQDEYPIWANAIPAHHLANEYKAWMSERWNHPSVVIWDAQNETITAETGKAIQQVRSLDLSNRPWDNGWSPPQSETDIVEAHPYLFHKYQRLATPSSDGPLRDVLEGKRFPDNGPNEKSPSPEGTYYNNPIIINEYGWLWLNRDGSPTTLSEPVYNRIGMGELTTDQRRELYARYLAALTEYWRGHRRCAGVLHFCGLGYSRTADPRGQTSDHFIDVAQLEYDPYFIKYVKPAFAPVGIMIDYWTERIWRGASIAVPVNVVNDTYDTFEKELVFELIDETGTSLQKKTYSVKVDPLGSTRCMFSLKMPKTNGKYELLVYYHSDEGKVFSSRKIEVK